MPGETLLAGIAFDVEHAEFHRGLHPSEARLRVPEEGRRNVGERPVDAAIRQGGEHRLRRRAASRADFEHPQHAILGEARSSGGYGAADHPVRRPIERGIHIESGQRRFGGEQHLQAVLPSPQHIGERRSRPAQQRDLHRALGIRGEQPLCFLLRIAERRAPRIVRFRQYPPAGVSLLPRQHPLVREDGKEPPEQALLVLDDLQRAAQRLGVHHAPRPARPTQVFERPQGVGARNGFQSRRQGRDA